MTHTKKHICVGICTYKRPRYLHRLIQGLIEQETENRFSHSIVVVDNDAGESAKDAVLTIAATSPIPVAYCVEPRQNIALARNMFVSVATGDMVAFLDDDEIPTRRWLLTLLLALEKYDVDGVLGPVQPHFEERPPKWVLQSRIYHRPTYPTGLMIDWKKGRTGNVLFKKEVFLQGEEHFRPQFLTGEDQDFFRRAIRKGLKFVWCNEALAYEIEPPGRWRVGFVLKRALLRGQISIVHPTFGIREIVTSLIAVPAYLVALPFVMLLGQGKLMGCLIRLCDHIGRLLALAKVKTVEQPYVTE